MAKKEFNIQTLMNLQKTVESMITNTSQQLIDFNPVLKDSKADVIDTNKLYDKLERLFNQLDTLKATISQTNTKKNSLGEVHQETIYRHGNLQKQAKLLSRMITSKNSRRGPNGQEDAYEFQISKSVLEERLLDIEDEVSKIKEAMTDFNLSNKAKIIIDETLELI